MVDNRVEIEVPAAIQEDWQEIVDLVAELAQIPAALIMRYAAPYIEVFASSNSQGNPYHLGDREVLDGSGLYCETVVKTQERLLVPDALADPDWKDNPDVKLDMISYLGFPIRFPDKTPFGTICVLDNKRNDYSDTVERLMLRFRALIESHLELVYANQLLGDSNERLTDYLMELQVLRGIVPMCSHCKSIKDGEDTWHPVEHFLTRSPETTLSHGICPKCMEELYPDLAKDSQTDQC